MDATVAFAALLIYLSGSPLGQQYGLSLSKTPVAQQTFIEVNLADPVNEQKAEIANGKAAEGVADSVIESPVATAEPVANPIESLDQIEPLFVEEVAVAPDTDTLAVEVVPLVPQAIAVQPDEQNSELDDAIEPATVEDDCTELDVESLLNRNTHRVAARQLLEFLLTPLRAGRVVQQSGNPEAADETVITASPEPTEPASPTAELYDVPPQIIVDDVLPANDVPVIHERQPVVIEQDARDQDNTIAEPVIGPNVEKNQPVEEQFDAIDPVFTEAAA
ncbi:MAG TPA: hypothetical protein VGM05_00865 [Planctomycetaceae bacterium]|jgi:hypothetical protein